MLVLDAFSSDAIPTHLLTCEALQLYLDKLTEDGLLVFHISNRFLNLELLLGKLANTQSLGPLQVDENTPAWTDQYTSVFSYLFKR